MPNFVDVLYGSLPEIYRKYDTDNQVLYRFLSIFGEELDGVNDKSLHFIEIMDPDLCDASFLPYLAQRMGIEILPGVTTVALRQLIKSAKLVWKMKGTLKSIQIYCQALTGWTIAVTDVYKTVPTTNSAAFVTNTTMITWNSADVNANHILLTCGSGSDDAGVIATKTGLLNQSLPKLVPSGVPWVITFA
jgi:phage tail-like protein